MDYMKMIKKLVNNLFTDRAFYIIAIVALIPGIILRFYDLNIDPPQFFSRMSRALLTDPYNLTSFARNKALFDQWDIFDYPRWIAFKYSLSSASGYMFFNLFGVSRVVANLSALFLNLGGLALFLFGLKRESIRSAVVAALVLIPCMVLTVYGRFPFLENGLIFLCGLLYYVFTRYYPANWVLYFSGVMITLCMLSGKMFGIVMIVPILLIIRVENKKEFWKQSFILISSSVISLILLAMLYYGENIGTVYRYMQEQTVGMYGAPEALTSPLRLIENLFTFGSASKLYYFSPFVTLLLFVSCLSLILRSGRFDKWLKENRQILFCLGWLVAGYLFLMFPNYRPLRYQLFLILPIAGIIAITLSSKLENIKKVKLSRPRSVLLFYIGFFFIFQFVIIGLIGLQSSAFTIKEILISIIIAVSFSIVCFIFRDKTLKVIHHKSILLTIFLLASICYQYYWSYSWFKDGTYTFQTAGRELQQNLGENAVVAGPYSQSLTADNNLKAFIYMFGMSFKDPTLFNKFPFTHLAMDASNLNVANVVYPGLKISSEVAMYWIRDVEISILRIDREAMGLRPVSYMLSDYEIAIDFFTRSELDSTYYYLGRFIKKYPDNRSALMLMPEVMIMRGSTDLGFAQIQKVMQLFPDDFSIFLKSGFLYYRAYLITGSEPYRIESDKAFNRAIELNPYIEDQIPYIKNHVSGILGQ